LQEGILFHHLLGGRGGDPYLFMVLLSFTSRAVLDQFVAALQRVIDRHDALRTAMSWEHLPHPVQVVHRRAPLPVEAITFEMDQDPIDQLRARMTPAHQGLDLRKAPLMRLLTAPNPHGTQWYGMLQLHHIVCDNMSLDTILQEVKALFEGQDARLPHPVPFRNHVFKIRSCDRLADHEAYFRRALADIDDPTMAFGLLDSDVDPSSVDSTEQLLDEISANRIRIQARRFGVSAATLFHSAWSLVLAHVSGRNDVVFGSVLLGRLDGQADTQRAVGLFINTLPFRVRLGGVTAAELIEQTQRAITQLLTHENAPLSLAQQCVGAHGSTPLFNSLLNYRHGAADLLNEFGGTSGLQVLTAKSWTNYPILLSIDERGRTFALTAQTARPVESSRVTGYLREALQSLVIALETAPDTTALSLSILPSSEREEVLKGFNLSDDSRPPRNALVHELFEEQARLTPQAPAIAHEGNQLTYAELNGRANQLARFLRHRGVGPDAAVGICVERSLEMVIGLLAILKAGGAYMPLDPSYPADRLQHMLEDAAPRIVLTQSELVPVLPSSRAEVVVLDERLKEIGANIRENLPRSDLGLSPQHLVYVIYTSGSTGRPKGTAMPHRSMVNLIEWHRGTFSRNAGARVLQFAALSFDVAFQETFSTLCTGGTLVLVDEWIRRDARALVAFLREQSIQRLFVPPLMLQSLAESATSAEVVPRSLQDIITAGEQLRITPEVTSLFKRLQGCRLHNHYGPTETHVVTALTLAGDPEQWPALPAIGRPIWNTQIYVLDNDRRPAPIGVAGELYIGGIGVARGYLRKPDLTAQRFVPDSFSSDPEGRLYRTGDLARWRPDGTLEYLGRNDFQIKIRGYRIEPGEIEAQLSLHPQVKEAAVVAREAQDGQKRIVAYLTPRSDAKPPVESLRAHLKSALPEHMLPSAFVILESLPLTPSGKLDRRALPPPELDAFDSRQYAAPQGDNETIIAGVWQRLLSIERIGRDDNFFELGGHSLSAMRAISEINERIGCSLRVLDIYQSPSLRELAGRIAGRSIVDSFIDVSKEIPVELH
jgi:amino acid adenylation domain-containing protein